MGSDLYTPMKEKELAAVMMVRPEDRPELSFVLNELLQEGRITINKRGLYRINHEEHKKGIFSQNPKGFGFIRCEGGGDDFYVAAGNELGAMDSDEVEFTEIPARPGRSREARVLKIVERGQKEVTGLFSRRGDSGVLLPDNQRILTDIYIAPENTMGAMSGHKVVAEILSYGDMKKKPEGRIIEILGHKNDPGVDILSIVRAYGIPEAFPEEVLEESDAVSLNIPEEERTGREDLRGLSMVTIDGLDAKDLDDAVSLKVTGEDRDRIYELGVHIADVSHYVTEGSALDREALNRSTSVYLADRVIPMLPVKLSNGICSLNAGEDRLAMSVLMKLDAFGNMLDYRIVRSVIHVDRRMSYDGVLAILEGREEECDLEELKDLPESLRKMLLQMADLADILAGRRRDRGAIDFEFPECKIELDAEGRPVSIRPYLHTRATDLIEDFMLLANETVAQHYYWLQVPFLYRVHALPDPDKMKELTQMISAFGYSLKKSGDRIHPKEIQKLLAGARGTPEEALISRLSLRSLKQACYSVQDTGHFGLALEYYSHFTSPIRRYPDLQIHRIITDDLTGRLTEERKKHYADILEGVALRTSKLERRADEAERETDKLKKCQYMKPMLGDVFEGMISGVTSWGFYVELEDTVEGLVHVSNMTDDHYIFDERLMTLTGEKRHHVYKLGQKVTVQLAAVDTVARTIDFCLYQKDKNA